MRFYWNRKSKTSEKKNLDRESRIFKFRSFLFVLKFSGKLSNLISKTSKKEEIMLTFLSWELLVKANFWSEAKHCKEEMIGTLKKCHYKSKKVIKVIPSVHFWESQTVKVTKLKYVNQLNIILFRTSLFRFFDLSL